MKNNHVQAGSTPISCNPARSLWLGGFLGALVFGSGCGGLGDSGPTPTELYEQAKELERSGDYTKAVELYEEAAAQMHAYAFEEARYDGIACAARAGNADEALAELDDIEQTNMTEQWDRYWAARAYVYKQLGNSAQANRCLAEARKINPQVELYPKYD